MATAFHAGFAPIWPISVAAYHDMIDKGILKSDDPVELLEGVIVQKMGKNPPHRIATRATCLALERSIPTGWYVDTQEPITTDSSEPEPDVAVLRGDSRDYPDRHPGAGAGALQVGGDSYARPDFRMWTDDFSKIAGILK
jgi:hypothetical protein